MAESHDDYLAGGGRELPRALAVLPQVTGTIAVATGALVLAGWILDSEVLKRGLPGYVAMNPATAVAFILAGTGLLMCREREHPPPTHLVRVIACTILMVGLVKLLGLIAGWHPNVDELLFASKLNPSNAAAANRMAPNTAFCFICLGLSLLFVDRQVVRFSLSQAFALVVAFCALLSLTGYAYGVKEFYGIASFIPMAIHTAVLFLLLAGGVFFCRSKTPFSQMFATAEPRGVLARRLFPSAVFLVLLLGWLRLKGEALGWYEPRFGTALFAITLCVSFFVVISWSILTIGKVDRERTGLSRSLIESKIELQESLQEIQLILNHARELICTIDNSGKILTMSVAAEQILGLQPTSLLGRAFTELHPADERARIDAVLKAAQAGFTRGEATTRCTKKDGSLADVVWSMQYSVHHKRTFCVGREVGGGNDRSAWAQFA